jgi:hypothetical protein
MPHSAGTLRTAKLDFLDVKDGDLLRPPHLRMPPKLHGAAVELNYSHFSAPRIGCFRRVGKSSVAAGASWATHCYAMVGQASQCRD